jgi:hypothetical protein
MRRTELPAQRGLVGCRRQAAGACEKATGLLARPDGINPRKALQESRWRTVTGFATDWKDYSFTHN